jgi:site-specific DNA-methyltransferase (adenine-specific)
MKPDILTPFLDDADVILYAGDCVEVMQRMPGSSVDAIVTDPPYGLEFMGKGWDGFGTPLGFQTWTEAWAREAFRILKPGGHLLAFAGTRTYHRMASGVEDAGFEIRDCIAWMYGSGFPKSLDVSKAIDKAAGAEREIVQVPIAKVGNPKSIKSGHGVEGGDRPFMAKARALGYHEMPGDRPATPEASKWHGWGTALKPAFEPVVVARRPLIGTVAANVLEHGTGSLNIDACRIGTEAVGWGGGGSKLYEGGLSVEGGEPRPANGRWPANVALDATAAAMLDEQSGLSQAKDQRTAVKGGNKGALGAFAGSSPDAIGTWPADPGGGASRFFYTAKASRQDRNVGGLADNTHPTVKPTDLMRWLIRLVTPPGGIILDPFGGSGSTGLAARAENVRCILIEREPEYLQIIRDRLAQQNLFATETTTDAT